MNFEMHCEEKKTMFLPSPKSGGFVLDSTITTCPKTTVSPCFCPGWSLHAQFALPIKQNLSLRDSKYNAEIVHVLFVHSFLTFMRILIFVQLHYENTFLFFTTPHVHTDGSCSLCIQLQT